VLELWNLLQGGRKANMRLLEITAMISVFVDGFKL
jgi:hypothetical protein